MKRLANSPKVPRPHHKRRPTKGSRRLSKKALDESFEAQGELPNSEGRVVV
jgi:hypothetical protein